MHIFKTISSNLYSGLSSLFIYRLAVIALLFVTSISDCFASGGPQTAWDLRYHWFNFIVYILILFFALRKVIPAAWVQRKEQIANTVRDSVREFEDAELEVKKIEDQIKELPLETKKIHEEILYQAEAEASALLSITREKTTRMKLQAEELLEGEGRAAQNSFRQALVTSAVQLAKESFQVTGASDDEKYREAALNRTQKLVQ